MREVLLFSEFAALEWRQLVGSGTPEVFDPPAITFLAHIVSLNEKTRPALIEDVNKLQYERNFRLESFSIALIRTYERTRYVTYGHPRILMSILEKMSTVSSMYSVGTHTHEYLLILILDTRSLRQNSRYSILDTHEYVLMINSGVVSVWSVVRGGWR